MGRWWLVGSCRERRRGGRLSWCAAGARLFGYCRGGLGDGGVFVLLVRCRLDGMDGRWRWEGAWCIAWSRVLLVSAAFMNEGAHIHCCLLSIENGEGSEVGRKRLESRERDV